MDLQDLETMIAPIPAETFAATLNRLMLVDQRLALEAARTLEQAAANADAGKHQQAIESLTTQINVLQAQIDAL